MFENVRSIPSHASKEPALHTFVACWRENNWQSNINVVKKMMRRTNWCQSMIASSSTTTSSLLSNVQYVCFYLFLALGINISFCLEESDGGSNEKEKEKETDEEEAQEKTTPRGIKTEDLLKKMYQMHGQYINDVFEKWPDVKYGDVSLSFIVMHEVTVFFY